MLICELQQSDLQARAQAIDPQHSFIIQAPAGSGKTEILTQRFLNLLAQAVANPEEIIAITFTRKAASEMRERVMHALEYAATHAEPTEPHKKITWQLAKDVLRVNQEKEWHLLANPNRLRILTIDALSAMLSAQIPLLSGFGFRPEIIQDPARYYQQAVHEVLQNPTEWQTAIETLLLHFDNNATLLADLIKQLLMKREQWLPYIYLKNDAAELKKILQESLKNIALEILLMSDKSLPESLREILLNLARFAAEQLQQTKPEHPICLFAYIHQFPNREVEFLPYWRAIAELLLTGENEWRKKVDARNGFPPSHKQQKQFMQNLLNELTQHENLRQALIHVRNCPPLIYNDQQWEIIQALLQLLPRVVAELHMIFRRHGIIDFVELTLGALRALGDMHEPTDLALYLDYQIRHILVDEFQDTSVMQFTLLKKLVHEWMPEEGKTLFLVGDPMQSIYRFRNAEVGLFLQAQQHSIENIKLIPLQLRKNFRSLPHLVEWFNRTFNAIFPSEADITSGRVPYSASIAAKPESIAPEITYSACNKEDSNTNIKNIISKVQALLHDYPEESIAILVRARSHLMEIIPELIAEQITYQAVELDSLNNCAEIRDLLTLTKAVLHLGDRVSWLALLRAPWCGLLLADLHAICEFAENRPLWVALSRYSEIPLLSEDAKQRLAYVIPLLNHHIAQQGRIPLASWIKNIWIGLNGPACLNNATALANAECYFNLLEEIQYEFSLDLLEQKIEKLYAIPNNPIRAQIQIMTIHKSKGLEFDHVILPELQYYPPADRDNLLMWLEHPNIFGHNDLIFAPIKASHEKQDPIHAYLKRLEKIKLEYESARVFYVAATRAKKSLHLFCRIKIDEQGCKAPTKGSFLDLIWDKYQTHFLKTCQQNPTPKSFIEYQAPILKRLPSETFTVSLELSEMSYGINSKNSLLRDSIPHCFGTVMHEALQHNSKNLTFNYWVRRLRQLGVAQTQLEKLASDIQVALKNIFEDERGQWILTSHANAQNEYALTVSLDGKIQRFIIDRTFVDEFGVRWIIDYKAAIPHDESLEDFLIQQKQQYRAQLEKYAMAFNLLEKNPIKLGLYFPLCKAWTAWDFTLDKKHAAEETAA